MPAFIDRDSPQLLPPAIGEDEVPPARAVPRLGLLRCQRGDMLPGPGQVAELADVSLDELLEEAEEFADDAPDAIRELADHVIVRIERLLNYENCYGDAITEALERAQEVHLAACRAGAPDPERLAGRLVTGALESGWGVFRNGPADYADVLSAAGLARYQELLKLAPVKSHGVAKLRASLAQAEEALGGG